jgi:hypothetical protein
MQENAKAKDKTQCSIGDTQIKTPDDTARLGNDPQSIDRFETILHSSLTGLFEELGRSDWYIREHEIVNLFTFGYLVPEFQAHGLDLTMIGIEFPVMQVDVTEKSRFGARKDLVIWPERLTTLWKDCELAPHMKLKDLRFPGRGRKPFAIIEWKVISRIQATDARRQERAHNEDIAWLTRNLEGRMMTIGYAVLVTQQADEIKVKCVRISDTPDRGRDFMSLRMASRLREAAVIPLGIEGSGERSRR